MSEELTNNESRIESTESNQEMQELDNATLEPRTFVEENGNFRQSEEIQENLVQVTENEVELPDTGTAEATPITIPDKASEVEATPITIPKEVPELRTDLDQVTMGEDDTGTMPIPLPKPEDVEEATPINLPDVQRIDEARSDVIEATPIPLPGPGDEPEVRGDLDQVILATEEPSGDEATPFNLPDVQMIDEAQSNLIEATPIPLPGPGDESEVRGDLDQAEFTPVVDPGDEATPINLPGTQYVSSQDDWEAPIALSPDDVKVAAPIPLPNPEGIASEDDWEAPNALSPDDVKSSDDTKDEDQKSNFEIQELMSRQSRSQSIRNSAQKGLDKSDENIKGKIG